MIRTFRSIPGDERWGWDRAGLKNNTTIPTFENLQLSDRGARCRLTDNGTKGVRLNTRESFRFTEGRVDFIAKLPTHEASWPALWTMGDPWPTNGEVDIVETGFHKGQIDIHYHPGGFEAVVAKPRNASTIWHKYSVIRKAAHTVWLIDGQRVAACETPTPEPHWLCVDMLSHGGEQPDDRLFIQRVEVYEP